MLNLKSLNESQLSAVTHSADEELLVIAGPGSGKTYTITQRIFYLIEKMQIPPEEILVVTFTKDAALSMQDRFLRQSDKIYPVNFGTFHSIFYNILRQSQGNRKFSIIKEKDKREIICKLLNEDIKAGNNSCSNEKKELLNKNGMVVRQFLEAASIYKNTLDRAFALSRLDEEYKESFDAVFNDYEVHRRKNLLLDFDDMVYECINLFKVNEGIRAYWKKRFKHILIDEFQDINKAQFETIGLLKGENCRLFAVGDDDQSIYGFRGSEPGCMKAFEQIYDAKRIYLNINYRSTASIVNSSLKVIGQNKNRIQKDLISKNEQDGINDGILKGDDVVIKGFEEKDAQYEYIINELKNNKDESLGILFRTNIFMQSFAARLYKENIEFCMKEKESSIYEHYIIKDVLAYLKLSGNLNDAESFYRIINKPLRYINREAGAWEGENLISKAKRYYIRHDGLAYRKERLKALDGLERDLAFINNKPLYLAVNYIFKKIGYGQYVMENIGSNGEKKKEAEDIFEMIMSEAKRYAGLEEWISHIEDYNSGIDNIKNKEGKNTNIQLMTVHGSKGLEFDRVWIPDCNENVFPHGRMPDEKTCEEERRIFYVGMTRAKKNLELLYVTGTKERPRLPSRFLNPLRKQH